MFFIFQILKDKSIFFRYHKIQFTYIILPECFCNVYFSKGTLFYSNPSVPSIYVSLTCSMPSLDIYFK